MNLSKEAIEKLDIIEKKIKEGKLKIIEIDQDGKKENILTEDLELKRVINNDIFFKRLILSSSGVGISRVEVSAEGICMIRDKNPRTYAWVKIADEYGVPYIWL